MRAQDTTSPVEMTWIGIGLGICGVVAVLIGLGFVAVPGGRANLHGPLWLVALIGVIVLLAGVACVIQGIGRANASAELPADAPFWMHAALYLAGVAMFFGFAVLGTWIAFVGDARSFSGGIAFLGPGNVSLARILFCFGAVICWLAAIAYAVKGASKLMKSI
jgi:hypothetical protein